MLEGIVTNDFSADVGKAVDSDSIVLGVVEDGSTGVDVVSTTMGWVVDGSCAIDVVVVGL